MPKTVRRLNCSYIYTNGTLVQTFVEERDGVRIGETVDITLGFCKLSVRSKGDIWEGFRGHDNSRVARVVVSSWGNDGFLTLARGGAIEATMPNLESGSENTRSKGLPVQYVSLRTAKGLKLDWCEIPSLISSRFTIQDEQNLVQLGDCIVGGSWGGSPIWKVTDLRPKPSMETPAFMRETKDEVAA